MSIQHQPRIRDLRAGANVTVIEDARGYVVSATGGSGAANSVEAIVDFGTGDTDVMTTVAVAWVAAGTEIVVTAGDATADHDIEDAALEGLLFSVGNRVPGVSFDLYAYAPDGTFGQFKVNCVGV